MPTREVILSAALAVSGLLNLGLAAKVHDLRKSHRPPRSGLRDGEIVSTLRVKSEQPSLSLSGTRPTLLYVYSPTCGWCTRNHAAISSLANQVKDRYRVVGACVSDCEKPAGALPFETYVLADRGDVRLRATPQTAVLSPDGKIIKVWQGAFGASVQREIETYFRVELPATPGT
jgi:hypothetical protein